MARRVDLKDQNPLIVKSDDLVNGTLAVCRCGLSSNWPYCNGTHKATRGEDPGKLYRYERELPQGSVRRIEIGELEMPDAKAEAPGQPRGAVEHDGAAKGRPHRPERGVPTEGTRGNEAGAEGRSGDAEDELVTTNSPTEANTSGDALPEGEPDVKPLATGGAEAILQGGKNRSGQGGESA